MAAFRGRVWETKPGPGDRRPFRDAPFVAGVVATAFVGLTVAFMWLVREPVVPDASAGSREVSLGDFRFGTVGGSPVRALTFEAVAILGGPEAEQRRGEEWLRSRPARVTQAVQEAGRVVTAAELKEPDLGTFRRRLRGGINRILPARVVEDVVLNEFRAF
ncbi:MAG TPA: hypothetical protein VF170_04585 [Planctomycetaceae bacterium]